MMLNFSALQGIRFKPLPIEGIVINAGFEVLTPTVMKRTIFCGVSPCSPLNVNGHFRGTCRRALLATCFNAGFLAQLLLDPEDGSDMFNGLHGSISQKFVYLSI